MVRETRLSWDDSLSVDLPERRDRFDDLDDEFLDVFANDKSPAIPSKKIPAKKRRKPEADTPPRRHLAGADWLNDEPKPPRRT